MARLLERFRNGWNAFLGRDPTYRYMYGGSSTRPDRFILSLTNYRSIVSSIYERIAVDVASMNIRHVRLDEEDNFKEIIKSDLNSALTIEANIDQTGRELIKDAVMSMFDEGCVSIIPTDTEDDPEDSSSFKIYTLRTGKIVEWYPTDVRLDVYNERTGQHQEIELPKRTVAIVENPFYSIMNEPDSTLQRLIRVLNQLDRANEESNPGKMDLIIQLPYVVKSKARENLAEKRRKELEDQMTGSKYGIGYIDGTERVIQLNRSIENNLWNQAKELTAELYNKLGLTQSIFDGTADEQTLLNYYDRTINPIITAISEEMERKWISKTARTQGQAIRFFRNPFKLIPVGQLAELSDKLTRNEIMTSNEIRSVIGLKSSNDPNADKLRNSNLNHPDENQNQDNSQINVDVEEEVKHSDLYHHGIEGQKWGVRNGPPYPLSKIEKLKVTKKKITDAKEVVKNLLSDDFKDFGDLNKAYLMDVKYDEGRPKGFVMCEKHNENGKTVVDMSVAVDPKYRKQGLGKEMASDFLNALSEEKKISKVYWGVEKNNKPSINMAESLGFRYSYRDDKYIVYEK